MKRNIIEQVLLYDYRYLIAYIGLVVTALVTHLWRLGDLVPGLSRFEAQYVSTLDWGSLIDNPLFWPHKVLTLLLSDYASPEAMWLRAASVVVALGAIALFFFLIRNRFRDRVSIIAVGLLMTSSWWLHFARLARPEIMIPFAIFAIMLLAKKAHETKHWAWLLALVLVVASSLYIPAMPYVILLGAFVTRSLTKQVWRNLKPPLKIGLIVTAALITGPLLVAIGRDLTLLRSLLLLPETWISPLAIIEALVANLGEIFWSREVFWPLGLGTLPLLDLFTAVMVALGLYHLDREVSRSLAYFVLVGLSALLVLVSIDPGPTDSIVLLPFFYTLVAAGIVMLLTQWYEIFPRNPIARLTAFIPAAFLLLTVVWYHQQRYFVAWPQTPETIEHFAPLSEDITAAAQLADDDQTRLLIYVVPDEQPVAQAATLGMEAEIITDPLETVLQEQAIISQAAYESLDASAREALLPASLMPVTTPLSSAPVSIWTNIQEQN